ncbi:MAG: type II toxin-antitoxin system HicA family toxin [Roseiflexaceae bacterium]
MRGRHYVTLCTIFEDLVKSNIHWQDIEAMLIHVGAELSEGRGSRVRIALNGRRAVFHRPHPQKETDKGSVKSLRDFLIAAGVEP